MRLPIHSSGLRRLVLLLFAVCVVLVAGAVALVHRASATTAALVRFTKPGSYVWTVPKGATNATFTVYGASGGGALQRNANHTITILSSGGLGGEAKATFTVHAGEKFEIVVGGQGGSAYVHYSGALGGTNGGGSAESSAGGGGGASDVRLGGRGNRCAITKTCGFGDRIVVGGGGGGGGGNLDPVNGLSGGGLTGAGLTCPNVNGSSATQECGGMTTGPNGASVGGFGFGGDGPSPSQGGGGGGWFGGGGGVYPGGGGSGYISPFAKSGSFPGGHQQGDGKVTITTTT